MITTLNVQQIESLADPVRQIVGALPSAQVPDEFLGRADQIEVVDITPEAEDGWCEGVIDRYVDASRIMALCTPSRLNNEGHPETMLPRNGNFGGGLGDFFGYRQVLADWRERGDFEGFELHPRGAGS